MASPIALKPAHAPVRAYYLALAQLANVGAKHETAVREAWHTLIQHGKVALDYGIDACPQQLCAILARFFTYPETLTEDFEHAVEFRDGVLELVS